MDDVLNIFKWIGIAILIVSIVILLFSLGFYLWKKKVRLTGVYIIIYMSIILFLWSWTFIDIYLHGVANPTGAGGFVQVMVTFIGIWLLPVPIVGDTIIWLVRKYKQKKLFSQNN